MKKTTILSLGMSAAILLSCSGDDNANPQPEVQAQLTGKWEFTEEGLYNPNGTSSLEPALVNAPGCNKNFYEFNANNVMNEGYYTASPCTLYNLPGTYVKNANTLTIDLESEPAETAQIIQLDATTLKLVFPDNGGGDNRPHLRVYKKV